MPFPTLVYIALVTIFTLDKALNVMLLVLDFSFLFLLRFSTSFPSHSFPTFLDKVSTIVVFPFRPQPSPFAFRLLMQRLLPPFSKPSLFSTDPSLFFQLLPIINTILLF